MIPGAGPGLVFDIAVGAAVLVLHCHRCAEEMHSKEKERHEPTMRLVVIVQVLQYHWAEYVDEVVAAEQHTMPAWKSSSPRNRCTGEGHTCLSRTAATSTTRGCLEYCESSISSLV
jgi:hypothetical protein